MGKKGSAFSPYGLPAAAQNIYGFLFPVEWQGETAGQCKRCGKQILIMARTSYLDGDWYVESKLEHDLTDIDWPGFGYIWQKTDLRKCRAV